jgi:putative PIN family toxin of toxin-antitoxin system
MSELSKILKKVADGEVNNYTSIEILDEFLGVTSRKKIAIRVPEKERKRFLSLIEEISIMVTPRHKLDVVKDDPSDNKILECAVEAKADYIITGDQHLLRLKRYKNIKITNPSEFIKTRHERI